MTGRGGSAGWTAPPVRRTLVGTVLTGLATLGLILMAALPAAAHPAGVPAATDYRTSVRGVTPALPGLTVRFVADNSQLELTSTIGETVEVVGYQDEPLLQVRTDGVWHNTRAPSLYVDQPGNPASAHADAAAAPRWRRVSGSRTARWHDHRTVWHGRPPPPVLQHPDRRAHIRDWSVPLRLGDRPGDPEAAITGSLEWLPPPVSVNWWGGIGLAALAVTGLGLARTAPGARSATLLRYALAAVSAVAGLGALSYAGMVAAHIATPGAAGTVAAVLSQLWPILTGLAALAASAAALARRAAADFALALAGACVAVMAGLGNAAVFAHSVAPVPVDAGWARWLVAVTLAGATGLTGACAIRMYRDSTPHRESDTAEVSSGTAPPEVPGTSADRAATI
ncbi:MAG TPA: hypothetical protein VK453_05855 [Micromonosporaceae bacterium]|nr:hypothetical protein [Micromonosporaceae bacterium]